MAQIATRTVGRFFTKPSQDVYDMFDWQKTDAKIDNPVTGKIAFEQKDVEFPDTWSMNAVNIVSQKYFTGTPGTSSRETSLRDLINRVADTIVKHGQQEGYFADKAEGETLRAELKYILTSQRASFNSPVWFNIGVPERAQQASACFILAVEDTMPAILDWYKEEGIIFKGGSGSGINVSTIRSSYETLGKSAGTASGPLSFMRGADASAGAIKSGGKTRRAAKMVVLNVDHPDVENFIWAKAKEERKARALEAAGFDMSLDGDDIHSIQYQNANNSIRVTDEFMEAVDAGDDWDFKAVTTGKTVRTVKARDVMRQFAEAAWECADPGMQFDTTINKWHTAPNKGRINGSNPCSEYMHLDNSACNLASINLLRYLNEDGTFDIDAFKHTVDTMITAQEILVGYSVYPTEKITKNAKAYRQLGLGYANLGAMLMAKGLPYDSEEGRALAGAITALMTGQAYATSSQIAKRVGPYAGFASDRDAMINVLKMHRDEVSNIDAALVPEDLLSAAAESWDEAVEEGSKHGVRNSQASVLAPTGTISFMMDCDTTGIEPDLGLVKMKKLVGGGTMTIVNQTVPRALKELGYSPAQAEEIIDYIDAEKTITGAPHVKEEHDAVFATSMGDNTIHYMGHVKMMAAAQPFLSGAISKTVNLPETATVEDIIDMHMKSWRLGLKAVAVYRDNAKVAQPLATAKKDGAKADAPAAVAAQAPAPQVVHTGPVRKELNGTRDARIYEAHVADTKFFFTVGQHPDGSPGELFVKIAKQGSTLAGVMESFAISVSYGLQYGVPLKAYVKALTNMTFAPSGITDDKEIRTSSSIIDYIMRRLAMDYLSFEDRLELGLASFEDMDANQASLLEEAVAEKAEPAVTAEEVAQTFAVEEPKAEKALPAEEEPVKKARNEVQDTSAPLCSSCGNQTIRAGACYVCTACGSSTGCG